MPIATFGRIREVSSEDKHHTAENLIKPHPGKTWKTCNVGEKLAYVILEMDEAKKIIGIDIGNEHSAFVEVLVGNATCSPSDFKEILLTCSFMTPIESRSSNNINRVRCFNEAALVPSTAERNWSLVKVVCTQPFNKHVQYGLAFIKVHVAASSSAIINQKQLSLCPVADKPSGVEIGKFKLREDSPDSDIDGASNLFNRWKKSKCESGAQTNSPPIAPNVSSCHAKDAVSGIKLKTDRPVNQVLDRNRDSLMFGGKEENIDTEKGFRLAKKLEIDKQRRLVELQEKSKDLGPPRNSKAIKSLEEKNDSSERVKEDVIRTKTQDTSLERVKKRHSSPPTPSLSKKEKNSHIQYKPFNKLLDGVVLVISGIQNPDRSDLRNKALSLGAKYKGDWDDSSTHLICAFKNTPKYNQVKGKGKIVTRSWIEKCYSTKKYLPWRRYALGSQDVAKPESDEEIHDESLKPQKCVDSSHYSDGEKHAKANRTSSLYDADNDQFEAMTGTYALQTTSDTDTDDEIKRVKTQNKKRKSESPQKPQQSKKENLQKNVRKDMCLNSTDVFELPTDEEDYLHVKTTQADTINKA